jgi:hypothetical protein
MIVPTGSPWTARVIAPGVSPLMSWSCETRRALISISRTIGSIGRLSRPRAIRSEAEIVGMRRASGSVTGSRSYRPSWSLT